METEDILVFTKPGLLIKADLPDINFTHISNLTDTTGIIQHALYDMPNLKEGYCIDDNSRALLLMVWAGKNKNNLTARRLLPVYLSFIHYMQTENAGFRNFMHYTKVCPEKNGSEDSFGRTLMALGYLVNEGYSPLLVKAGKEIFANVSPTADHLVTVRGIASSIIGLCQFIKGNYPDDLNKEKVVRLANKMTRMYRDNKKETWHWFEPVLAYDNAMLPLALLHAHELTGDQLYLSIAKESMSFLESKVFHNNMLRPIGNQGWLPQGGDASQFDQQGIDAMAMVLYYQQAWKLFQDKKYLSRMCISYQWFLGLNDLGLSLYDPETGGSADGLQAEGINHNKGAESTLSYWISHFAVLDVLNK